MRDSITTVLFDLDGTLLPMQLEEFTSAYFGLLAKKAAPYGYDAKELIASVWAGTKAMMKNDGSQSNCDVFWEKFAEIYGQDALRHRTVFDDFYAHEFNGAIAATQPTPLAKQVVADLKSRGITLVLATNPVFPLVAVEQRLHWLDIDPADFSLITSYENSRFCKPDPRYFEEILTAIGKTPGECLMVGNDAVEDLAAEKIGIETYLLTDCLINSENRELSGVKQGSFEDLTEYLDV